MEPPEADLRQDQGLDQGGGDFGKSRPYPLISAHSSRTAGWRLGWNGGGESGFGGDNHGFGGQVRGFGERCLELDLCQARGWTTGWIRAVG